MAGRFFRLRFDQIGDVDVDGQGAREGEECIIPHYEEDEMGWVRGV